MTRIPEFRRNAAGKIVTNIEGPTGIKTLVLSDSEAVTMVKQYRSAGKWLLGYADRLEAFRKGRSK